jgi:CRISPR-associated protein Cmr6
VEATAKPDWINAVKGECGNAVDLTRVTHAFVNLCEGQNGAVFCAATDWHLVTGLGLPHPVENGFQWHPTLGVPYLPGAAVKGLVRAYLESWAEPPADKLQWQAWFGSESKNDEECDTPHVAGEFIFFDALPMLPPRVDADVMTPHMGKWYELGDKINDVTKDADKIPADWHDPIPVPFLVVTRAIFLFGVAPRHKEAIQELPRVIQAVREALDWLGAGGKTAVGYGRLVRDEEALRKLRVAIQAERETRRLGRQKREGEQKMAAALASLPGDAAELVRLQQGSDWTDNGRFLEHIESFLKDRESLSAAAWQGLANELQYRWPGILENPDARVGKKGDKEKYKPRPRELARRVLTIKPSGPGSRVAEP